MNDKLLELKEFVKECILGCYVCIDEDFGSSRRVEDKAELRAYQNVLREIEEKIESETIEAIPINWLQDNMVSFDNDMRPYVFKLISKWQEEQKDED